MAKFKAMLAHRAMHALRNIQVGGKDPINGRRGILALSLSGFWVFQKEKEVAGVISGYIYQPCSSQNPPLSSYLTCSESRSPFWPHAICPPPCP